MNRSRTAAAFVLLAAVTLAACASDEPTGAAAGTTAGTSAMVVVTMPPADTAAPPASAPAPATPTAGTSAAATTAAGTVSPPTGPATAVATQPAPTVAPPNPDVVPVLATAPVGELTEPVDLAVRPGDTAAYVVEQPGNVVRVDLATGAAVPVLDVADLTDSDGEKGLLGLAFHPTEPFAYINYTAADDGRTVVAEYAVSADGTFDAASARTVLTIEQPYPNHNGGGLTFGADGYLYIGTGDGGSGGDPERRATDPFDLLGKLLRIDPVAGDPYAVPADNPFADGAAGAPEVWSIGLRNPWRFGFDPPTGDLWIADVGQNEHEEVNRVRPTDGPAGRGDHFGWSAFEGTAPYNTDVEVTDPVMPVLTYGHGDGCSISGGMVYRGAGVPDLPGWYLFSDYCTGTLWGLDANSGRTADFVTDLGPVTAVRPGPDGEAYVLIHSGQLLRVVPG